MKNIVRFNFVIASIISIFFSGCVKNDDMLLHHEKGSGVEQSHVIPLNEVLSNLEFYSGYITRSVAQDKIVRDVFVVGGSQMTKSSSADTLLYVINFENNEGYAVMAADDRISERLMMLSEVGNVTLADFYNEDNLDFLLDSLGFYNESRDDYLIGGEPVNGEKFILQGILEYANYQVNNSVITNPVDDIDDNPYITIPGQPRPDTWVERRNIVYETVMDVEPLLNTRWHQSSPYNDMVVPHGSYAGCVPIAVAQIMAFNQFPQNLTVNGIRIFWDEITKESAVSNGTPEAEVVAALIGLIQVSCHSLPFGKFGTFTFPCAAEDFLKSMGYTNVVRKKRYDENKVISCIKNGYPVFMSGMDGIAVWNAHA